MLWVGNSHMHTHSIPDMLRVGYVLEYYILVAYPYKQSDKNCCHDMALI